MLSLDELGFVEPSSVDTPSLQRNAEDPDAVVIGNNEDGVFGLGNGDRSILDSGGGSELASGEGRVAGSNSDGAGSTSMESAAAERDAITGGGVEQGTTMMSDVPKPRPMNVEGHTWDRKGDCLPLPAWQVRYQGLFRRLMFMRLRTTSYPTISCLSPEY